MVPEMPDGPTVRAIPRQAGWTRFELNLFISGDEEPASAPQRAAESEHAGHAGSGGQPPSPNGAGGDEGSGQ